MMIFNTSLFYVYDEVMGRILNNNLFQCLSTFIIIVLTSQHVPT